MRLGLGLNRETDDKIKRLRVEVAGCVRMHRSCKRKTMRFRREALSTSMQLKENRSMMLNDLKAKAKPAQQREAEAVSAELTEQEDMWVDRPRPSS